MKLLRKTNLCLMILWCLAALAWAKPEPVVPVPPDYVLDKQLEGEDPFDIAKPVFSPDNSFVAAFMHSPRVVTVWETRTGKVVAQIAEDVHHVDGADGLEFSTDGKQLILLRNFLPLKVIDWKAGKVVREIPLEADPKKILSYAISPDQSLLAVGTYTGIALWDMKAGKKLKEYLKGQAVSGLDMLITRDKQGRPVRLLSFGRALMPPDVTWKDIVGLINLDSGAVTPLLNDIPSDKKVSGSMTFFFTDFEWGGGHLLVTYSVFPPSVKAGTYLIDTWTGKYLSQQDLGQFVVKYRPKYLWKPFYGFVMPTADMTGSPYKVATQFLVPTLTGLKVLDTVDESKLATYGIRISDRYDLAAVVVKKDPSDTCKLFLYKLVPKKVL
ncbi:hypothetical protein IV102_23875 [bacterium]|nr:hypothetical protein [bacterium]